MMKKTGDHSKEDKTQSIRASLGISDTEGEGSDVLEAETMTSRQKEHLRENITRLRYIDLQIREAMSTGRTASLAFWQERYGEKLHELEVYMRNQGIPYRLKTNKDFQKEQGAARSRHRQKQVVLRRRQGKKALGYDRVRERTFEG